MPSNKPTNTQAPLASAEALDPTIVNLAKAIRDTESGGQPDPFRARGGSGEFGAYQFMPATWQKVAPQFGVNTALEMATPEEQNKVAYHYIDSLKKQGYNAGQIASIWNSGRSNPSGKIGVNASGIGYNTPQYVDNVYARYSYYKKQTPGVAPETPKSGLPEYYSIFPNQPDDTPITSGLKSAANVVPSAVGLVKDIATLVFNPIETAKGIAGVAIGGLESIDEELETENTEKFDAFVQAIKDRYGSLEALENTAVNDPFGFGADLLGVLYGGAAVAGRGAQAARAIETVGGAVVDPTVAAARGAAGRVAAPFGRTVDTATAESAARLGIDAESLPASARTTSRVVPVAEALAGKTVGGQLIADRQIASASRLKEIADDLVESVNGAEDLVVAGERVAKGVQDYGKKFKEEMNKLYDDFEAKRGDTLAQTSNSLKLIEDILERKQAIGDKDGMRFFENKYGALTAQKGRGKKRPPAPTYLTLKAMRSDIGERMKGFGDMFVTANKAQLKQLYAALTADMRATIKTTRNSKKLLEEMDAVNAAYRAGRTQLDTAFINSLLKMAKNKQFDKILPALLRPGTSVNDVKTIMSITGDTGTQAIRGALLKQIFDKATSAGEDKFFTPTGISKQLEKNGTKWRQILTPEQYTALEDLSRLSQAMGRSKRISEGSQTAYTIAQLGQLGIMGWSIIDLMSGNLAAFAQKWAFLGMSYGAAKFIASPMGQRFLTTGITRRFDVQNEVIRQGLTPPALGGMMNTYDNTGNTRALPGRDTDLGGDGERLPAPGRDTTPGGNETGLKSELAGALLPIIERAKTRSGLDFNVEDVQMTGSRSAGKGTKKSDMDVIVQISGTADEAAVLAALRRGRTKVDGAKVDYTVTKEPIADFRARTEDPEKYAAPLTSEFVPDTRAGRLKESLRRYIDNMGVGLSTRDVSRGGQEFEVGLTSVKGRFETGADDLVREGDELYAAGDFLAAQKKYNEALSAGIETLTRAYEGTGIKVKPKGVGFGVYGGLEPNYDAIAVVPKGKEDLFHYVLADVADRDFKQYSMLTTRQTALDTPYGVIDEARGISVEPSLHFVLEKPLSGADVTKVQELAAKNSLAGFSLREGGKSIDITNLSAYNKDYEKFKQDIANFSEDLGREGFSGVPEYRTAETRFVGSDPAEGHGLASYQSVRSQFRQENPDFFNSDEGFTSRVIDRIKNRQTVSPMEIEQLTKMQDITPLERSVVLSALEDLKDVKKIPTKDLVARIEGKSLPVSMYETDSYASYGIDNVNIRENRTFPKTLVFETPVEHGSSGHFNNPRHFGHTRVAIVEEGDKKIGYITEMQSDVAQKADFERGLARTDDARRKERAEYEEANKEEIKSLEAQERELNDKIREKMKEAEEAFSKKNPEQRPDESYTQFAQRRGAAIEDATATLEEQRASVRARMGEMEAELASKMKDAEMRAIEGVGLPGKQLVALLKDRNKYQDVMLRGTLQYFEKQGVQEVRVATPSTAAKIEGFVDDDGGAPYELPGGGRFGADADDLDVGEEVVYLGEDYVVVQADGGEISIAPREQVREFTVEEFIEGEKDDMWLDTEYELKKHTDAKGLVSKKAFIREDKMAAYGGGDLPWIAEKAFDGIDEAKTLDELKDLFDETFYSEFDWREQLDSLYGDNAVFQKTTRVASKMYRTDMVYVVEDTNKIENFNQPSEYSGVDESALLAIDEDPSEIGNYFSGTQQTVLENYVDLRNGALKKLEKTEGVKIKGGTSDDYYSNPSWYSFPMTKVKRYLFGA